MFSSEVNTNEQPQHGYVEYDKCCVGVKSKSKSKILTQKVI